MLLPSGEIDHRVVSINSCILLVHRAHTLSMLNDRRAGEGARRAGARRRHMREGAASCNVCTVNSPPAASRCLGELWLCRVGEFVTKLVVLGAAASWAVCQERSVSAPLRCQLTQWVQPLSQRRPPDALRASPAAQYILELLAAAHAQWEVCRVTV
jgi:hypothetical protein